MFIKYTTLWVCQIGWLAGCLWHNVLATLHFGIKRKKRLLRTAKKWKKKTKYNENLSIIFLFLVFVKLTKKGIYATCNKIVFVWFCILFPLCVACLINPAICCVSSNTTCSWISVSLLLMWCQLFFRLIKIVINCHLNA